MTRRSPWPWLVLVVWSAWIYAVTGRASAEPSFGGWVPDLGLVLILALEPGLGRGRARRMQRTRHDALLVALVVGLARLAFTADAAGAVLAGVVAATVASRALRRFVEVDGVVVRGLLAGAAALFSGGLCAVAHLARADAALVETAPLATEPVLRAAGATAIAAVLLAPALKRLPGLSSFATPRGAFA